MNKLILFVGLHVLVVPSLFAQAVARSPVAFVHYETVFTNYYKARLANIQLQEMLDAISRERVIMLTQFDQVQQELKNLRLRVVEEGLGEEELQSLRRRIDARLVEARSLEERIKNFNETQEQRWSDQNRRIRADLMEEIGEKMKSYLRGRGFAAVVDSSLVSDKDVPAVLYLDENADITEDVIKALRQ
ncbi:MAG: OmpH family outer membrane protein [Kiritimatiellia bacterium]